MPLQPGTRLGPYEVTAPIGAGGMGEVYRAKDTKLGREVAIKVLPEDFSDHPERLARFEREDEAGLSHAVSGRTSADRVLTRGLPQLLANTGFSRFFRR